MGVILKDKETDSLYDLGKNPELYTKKKSLVLTGDLVPKEGYSANTGAGNKGSLYDLGAKPVKYKEEMDARVDK